MSEPSDDSNKASTRADVPSCTTLMNFQSEGGKSDYINSGSVAHESLRCYMIRFIAQCFHLFATIFYVLVWRLSLRLNLAYFDKVIEHQLVALQKTNPGEWWHSLRTVMLSEQLAMRYRYTHNSEDIDYAIFLLDRVLRTPTSLEGKPFRYRFTFFFISLWSNFTRGVNYLRAKLQSSQIRTGAITSRKSDIVENLRNLRGLYMIRFNIHRKATDLDDAIICLRRAIAFLRDDALIPYYLWSELAEVLHIRSSFRHNPDGLQDALTASQKAVDSAHLALDPIAEALTLAQYAQLLYDVTESNSPEEMSEVISIQRLAIDRLPCNYPAYPKLISQLASFLTQKGISEFWLDEHRVFPAALTEALALYENALASLQRLQGSSSTEQTRKIHSLTLVGLAAHYDHLHHIHLLLYNSSECARKALSYLDEAESLLKELPTDIWIQAQSIRCSSWKSIARHTRNHSDYDTAIDQHRILATSNLVSMRTRLSAAKLWVRFADHSRHPSVHEAAEVEIALSARLVGLGINAGEQLRQMGAPSRSNAISSAIPYTYSRKFTQADRNRQLTLIESGLSFFWSARLKTLRPFDIVAQHDPELKKELEDTASFINNTPNSLLLGSESRLFDKDQDIETEEQVASLRKAREKFENLLDQARQFKGLEYFMQPRPFPELCRAADKGHIIVLNAAGGSLSDIFVLKPQGSSVQHIQLTNGGSWGLDFTATRGLCEEWARLSRTSVKSVVRQARHVRRLERSRVDEDTQFRNYLKKLWLLVVNPILESLDLKKVNEDGSDSLPRVWWLPTGPVASLPFHAAGIYGEKVEVSAFNYVVSSYLYSVNALLDARQIHEKRTFKKQKFLAVAVPSAPNVPDLPNAGEEVNIIRNRIEDTSRIVVLEGSGASKEAVIAQLRSTGWLHMACHAFQEDSSVLGSHFIISDGKLTLEEIMRFNLQHAEFAMLSACETCTGDGTLTDDALHLAGGLMAAGFKSVIATRYSMQDADGPDMASMVYGKLLRSDGSEWDIEESARALHDALQDIRKRVSFRRWLPYVHIGI